MAMGDEELQKLREQQRDDRKLIQKAADVLAEISRGPGLEDHQAEVLAALRIRLEGKPRGSLEDLLSAAGDLSGKGDLAEALGSAEKKDTSDWPTIEEKKPEWPGL